MYKMRHTQTAPGKLLMFTSSSAGYLHVETMIFQVTGREDSVSSTKKRTSN